MKEFNIIKISGVELVPFFESPYFIMSEYKKGKRLLGYDFFIYIPTIGTLPDLSLSRNFSDFTGTEEEKISLALLDICDIGKIHDYFNINCKGNESVFFEEGIKFIHKTPSIAIIGYEFVYE